MKKVVICLLVVAQLLFVCGNSFAVKPGGGSTKYKNTIIVDVNGTGDFTKIIDAIRSISDNSRNNDYLIKILPGDYYTDVPVYTKDYIYMEGSGKGITNIRLNGDTNGFGAAVTIHGNSSLKNLTVYNERINLNQVVALATGGTGVDQPILISDIDVVVTNDYSNGTTAGIYVGGRANVTIENVDIVVNSTNGLGGHESGLFYRQSNNWAEISDLTVNNVNASVQGWQARGVYIEHGGYYNVLEAANISITNSNFSATGSVLGEGLYWTGGQLDLIDTNLFSGNTASIYVNDANGAIISNSTLIGIIDNASADIVLSNCVDGSGNPL